MKTLIAAVIASAFSIGAFAQSASAPMAAPMAPMAKKDAAAKPMDSAMHKPMMKKHAAKKAMKKASAPA